MYVVRRQTDKQKIAHRHRQNANTRTKPNITDCTARCIHLKIFCPSTFVQIHDVLEHTSTDRRFLNVILKSICVRGNCY